MEQKKESRNEKAVDKVLIAKMDRLRLTTKGFTFSGKNVNAANLD